MSVVDDAILKLQIFWATFQYDLAQQIAQSIWGIERGFFLMGYVIMLVNRWLMSSAFSPLIQLSSDTLKVATSWAFIVALFVLGITYLLSVWIRLDVVNPRNAVMWYLAGLLFFQAGPAIYQGFNDLRQTIAGTFYLSALNALQSGSGSAFTALAQVKTKDLSMLRPCDNFGPFLPGSSGSGSAINGLDVALAYLRADGIDIVGGPYPTRDNCQAHPPMGTDWALPLPWEWYRPGSFFDNTTGPTFFPTMTQEQREDAISLNVQAIWRLFSSWWLVLFGLAEQLVAVCLTVAQGFTFISFSMAILFAFFKRTEAIAWTVIDMQIELIVQMVVIAMIQALVAAFFLAGAATRNSQVVMGVGLVCFVFVAILLWSGLKAIWRSFNRLFEALGRATGGAIVSTGAATQTALGLAGAATGMAVTGGALALGAGAAGLAGLNALRSGATYAQAAGLAFGENNAFTSTAATLYRLPGLRGSAVGEAADQFLEGARLQSVTRDLPGGRLYAPFVGAELLTNRNPAAADYNRRGEVIAHPMLRPGMGETISVFASNPRWKRNGDSDEDDDVVEKPKRRGVFKSKRFIDHDDDSTVVAGRTVSPTTVGISAADSDLDEQMKIDMKAVASGSGQGGPQLADQRLSDASTRLADAASQSGRTLEEAGSQLERAARQQEAQQRLKMVEGTLNLSGQTNVASVMGDLVALLQQQRSSTGSLNSAGPISNVAVASGMAQVMNLTPLPDGKPPIREDLGRFQMYADQAVRLGLTGNQAEQVIHEVNESGWLAPATRDTLRIQVAANHGWRGDRVEREVAALEKRATLLPAEITAVGTIRIPVPTAPPIEMVAAETPAVSKIPVPQPPARMAAQQA